LFVPSLKRDIVSYVACTRLRPRGVAWQSTSDGENSYSHWAARRPRGRLRRVRSSRQGRSLGFFEVHLLMVLNTFKRHSAMG
jgi:hypothetical protein